MRKSNTARNLALAAALLTAAPLLAQDSLAQDPLAQDRLAQHPLTRQPADLGTAPAADLTLDQRMQLRCSAAFALVAGRQATGDAEALRYPPLGQRGREYFVRSAAKVMDGAGLDRAAIDAEINREARDLLDRGTLAVVMPICLQALEGSGL